MRRRLTRPIDPLSRLRKHPGMAYSKTSGERQRLRGRLPGRARAGETTKDDTALLTAALDHAWTWYDGFGSRFIQVVNYYLLASVIIVAAYTSAIKGNHYGIAVALQLFALGLTAVAAVIARNNVKAAQQALPVLEELQALIADKLEIKMGMASSRRATEKRMPAAAAIMFGLPALLNMAALGYAVANL